MSAVRKNDAPVEGCCPICECTDIQRIGWIHHKQPLMVAQVPLVLDQERFDYMRCDACHFHFKTPEIPAEALLRCYAQAEGDRWGHDVDPIERNFDRVASHINQTHRAGRILDIGCSNGAFLRHLTGSWHRFGIEPSSAACELAERSGISILASTIDQLNADQRFDVIVAMDVVEHLPKPSDFMTRLARHLVPGGIVLLTTGNTDAWSWRLQGARYWYCATFPEHVSFYNRRSIETLGNLNDLKLRSFEAMSYKRAAIADRFSQQVRGVLFGVGSKIGWLGIQSLRKRFAERAGTNWATARDHMIVVLGKQDSKSPQ